MSATTDVELFTCNQYSTPVRMLKAACIKRQQRIAAWQGVKNLPGQSTKDNMDQELVLSLAKCLTCQQGQENITGEKPKPAKDSPLRTCRECGQTKGIESFYQTKKDYRDTVCKKCRNKLLAAKRRERRNDA